jgi:hypothetical protein
MEEIGFNGLNNLDILKNTFKKGYITSINKLIIESYYDILKEKKLIGMKPLENNRRNCLVHYMEKNKMKHGLYIHIGSEFEEYDKETFKTLGRIDIKVTVGFDFRQENSYTYECKRIVKHNASPQKIRKAYINEGMDRFINLIYASNMKEVGMICFIEEGDINSIKPKIYEQVENIVLLGTKIKDLSKHYSHEYVLHSEHEKKNHIKFETYHLLFDFNESSSSKKVM